MRVGTARQGGPVPALSLIGAANRAAFRTLSVAEQSGLARATTAMTTKEACSTSQCTDVAAEICHL